MSRFVAILAFGVSAALVGGCGGDKSTSTPQQQFKGEGDGHEHTGAEVDVTLPDGTACHAVLAAHIAKDGEKALEVSFEDFSKPPKPVTLPENTKISLRVQRGEKFHPVDLKPGPKDERKSDPEGRCSRFEGDAEWMLPDDKFSTVTITIDGVDKKAVLTDFDVKKHTHAHDD